MRRLRLVALAVAAVALLAGCGGSSQTSFPTIGAAKTYQLVDFRPGAPVQPGVPTTFSFAIRQPDGTTLTRYRRGAGPHTGIHLILVRDDLGAIVHHHPAVAADGTLTDKVVLPTPGRYRVVVDAYPAAGAQPNFQLFRWVTAKGKAPAAAQIPFRQTQVVDGYRFTVKGTPKLRAVQAGTFEVDVTGPDGKPARFQPWYGATAHAIFFRKGDLSYFHTHICGTGQAACTSATAASPVSGTSTRPGQLKVGVLLAQGGTWRMFLQSQVDGKVLTVPFTLHVAPA